MPSAPVIAQRGRILGQPGIDHHADLDAVAWFTAGSVRIAANSARRFWLSAMRCSKPDGSWRVGRTMTLPLSPSTRIGSPSSTLWRMSLQPAEHRHAHRARDDRHVRGERAFLEHHALQPPPVVFEQFGRAEVARDQDRVAASARSAPRCRAGPRRSAAAGSTGPRGRASGPAAADRRSRACASACAAGRARSPPRRSGRCRSPR